MVELALRHCERVEGLFRHGCRLSVLKG
jgi:hypothetical protein